MSETILIYCMGKWIETPCEEIGHIPWDIDCEWKDYLRKNDFYDLPSIEIGDKFNFLLSIYPAFSSKKWLVDAKFSEDVNLFLIRDFPSFLLFLNDFKDVFLKKETKFIKTENLNKFINKNKINELNIEVYNQVDKSLSLKYYTNEEQGYIRKNIKNYEIYEILREEFGIE